MADPRGFLKLDRVKEKERPVEERIRDWTELTVAATAEEVRAQASRCMDCGIPFCHSPVTHGGNKSAPAGCPLGNLIPEWNDLVHRGQMDEAAARLHATNNFPEVTGRVCPAPCEASCVLNIEGAPVTIKTIERTIADHAFTSGGLAPVVASHRTGKRLAVIGSGPAGLAAAQELARSGHEVTLFEKDDRIGGLLRYGIPDFKMEKGILDLRLEQMRGEGVVFRTGIEAGKDLRGDTLLADYDAVVLAHGAQKPRDLPLAGRELGGVHFAMEFLTQQNRVVAGDTVPEQIVARGKRVVVIGGGDTGSDCVGTSIRQGAASVTQLELMPRPSLVRVPDNPWPEWPLILRTSSSQEEGAERDWAVSTRALVGQAGQVSHLDVVRVSFEQGKMREIEGSAFTLPCELVLLAMGFVGPIREGLVEQLGLALDARGNVKTDVSGATSVGGVFAAGDMSRGQSLVVWAIADGRRVAAAVNAYLKARARKSA